MLGEVRPMEKEKKKMKKSKKILIIVLVILVIIGAGIATAIGFINGKLNKINYDDIDDNSIEVNDGINAKLSGYRNILLFGIDNDKSYSGRSDCIIIFTLNENTNKVQMTSIYRDTYVEVPGHGYTKINHAYAYGGAALSMSTINRNLDLNVTEYATINFNVVKDIVDKVGGVTLAITSKEATQIPGISRAGTYTLNGQQALAYGRIRKIDTDYKRTERMRTVIDAVFKKVKKMSVPEMNSLLDQVLPEVHTNIKKNEIKDLMTDITTISMGKSIGWPTNVKGKMISGVWYGVPQTLKSSVINLHRELFNDDTYEPTTTVSNISDTIIKRTGVR